MNEYPSKIDGWLKGVFAISFLAPIGLGFYLARISFSGAAVCFAVAAFDLILLFLVVVPCRYALREHHLLIRSGLLLWKIPYADIREVEKSGNPLSSPALSLERVKISYRTSSILVSPERRDEFIGTLQDRIRGAA